MSRRRNASQNGSAPVTSRSPGREDGDEAEGRAAHAVGRRRHHRPQIGGEGEERPGHGLSGAVAGEKGVVAHPARRHHRGLQQGQHDVAAAEDERARAIERLEHRDRLARRRGAPRAGARPAAGRTRRGRPTRARADTAIGSAPRGAAAASRQKPQPEQAAQRDGGDLAQRRRRRTLTTSAASTAMLARSRSGARLRAMPHTAWATTATATILSPWSAPSASGPWMAAGREGEERA